MDDPGPDLVSGVGIGEGEMQKRGAREKERSPSRIWQIVQ